MWGCVVRLRGLGFVGTSRRRFVVRRVARCFLCARGAASDETVLAAARCVPFLGVGELDSWGACPRRSFPLSSFSPSNCQADNRGGMGRIFGIRWRFVGYPYGITICGVFFSFLFVGRVVRRVDVARVVPCELLGVVGTSGGTRGAALVAVWWHIGFPRRLRGWLLVRYRGGCYITPPIGHLVIRSNCRSMGVFSFRPAFFGVGRGQNLDETVLAVVFGWFSLVLFVFVLWGIFGPLFIWDFVGVFLFYLSIWAICRRGGLLIG